MKPSAPESPSIDAVVPRMFVPQQYVASDPRALIRRYPFATLITSTAAGMHATCLPFVFETDDDGENNLISHVAGRNAHAVALAASSQALVVFLGPHAYVSARWYKEKPEVPTWNYIAVQVRGTLTMLESREQRLAVLARTVEVMERDSPAPWTMDQAPPGMVDKLTDRVHAFRLAIEQIEGATKLNQGHPEGDRLRVIRGLIERGDPNELPLASLMAQMPPKPS